MKKTLVLNFGPKTKNVKQKIYRFTLEHIAQKLPNARIYHFSTNKDLLNYIQRHSFSTIVYTNEMPSETAFLLKGIGLVQILIGIKKELLEIADIIIDPLISKSDKYLVGTKYLLPSVLKSVSPEIIADIMSLPSSVLLEEVNHNESELELLEVVRLYQKLKWDSDFFNLNIGYISCLRLTPNIEKHIKDFIREEKIDMLEYRCNCHDRTSVVTSEESGYSFVDIRLTLQHYLLSQLEIDRLKGFSIHKGKKRDIAKLQKIAADIYVASRYYFDENFDRSKVKEFYQGWVKKAVLGTFDDFTYVFYRKKGPIGFCTIKKMRTNAAKIGLFGLDTAYRGKGLSSVFLNAVLKKLKEEEKIGYVEVVTQGRNYAAQRLYQRCGFVTKSTELWYHKWFR